MNQVVELPPIPHALERASSERCAGRELPSLCTDTIYVLYTAPEETLRAARVAAALAAPLDVPLTVVHLRTTAFAVPVDEPGGRSPLESEAFVNAVRREGIEVRVRVYLCRDERRTVPFAFKPHSLVVFAGRESWWPTPSMRRRRMFEDAGHFVLLVDTSDKESSDA